MRVLFTTTPGRGHYHPMLPLAEEIQNQGNAVLWAADEAVCARLRDAGFEASPAGLPEGRTSDDIQARYPEIMALPPIERPRFLFSKIFGSDRAAPMLDALLPLVRDWDPSVLVCDQAELAGPIAAAVIGVPNVTHSFGHPLPRDRVARASDEMSELWKANGLEPRPFAGTYDHLYLDIYPRSLQTEDPVHIPMVQPMQPSAHALGGAGVADPDLDGGSDADPLVYVTFGTVFNRDLEIIGRVVEGIRELPVRVLVTLGPEADPDALGGQPPNVRVTDYIPQSQVLPHCSAVVSHAGSGTFLASLGMGLPQLFLPQAADQFLNAEAGARAGVGISIDPADISAESVREGLDRLLTDPGFRLQAERLKAEIREMPEARVVVEVLASRLS